MHYIIFITQIIKQDKNLFFLVVAILTALILALILIYPYSYPVKIKNFFLAWFCSFAYLILYIILLLGLRFINIAKLDVGLLWGRISTEFVSMYGTNSAKINLILTLSLIIIILTWLILVIKIRSILAHQVWKLYYYYRCAHLVNKRYYQTGMDVRTTKYNNFIEWCDIFERRLSVYAFGEYMVWGAFFSKFFRNLFNNNVSINNFVKYLKLSLFLSVPLVFLLDCVLNKGVIFFTFLYLIIFMVLRTWIQVSDVIHNYRATCLDHVLIKRAYGYPDFLYANLTKAEEKIIQLYVTNHEILEKFGLDINFEYDEYGLPYHFIHFRREFILFNEEGIKIEDFPLNGQYAAEWGPFYWNEKLGIGFKLNELEEINGKYFVHDANNTEAMAYYDELKKMVR